MTVIYKYFAYPSFRHLGMISQCGGQTDRQAYLHYA